MTHSTTRLALNIPDGTDAVSAFPGGPISQALGVLDGAVTFSQGTVSARPAASLAGRVYYATDVGQFFSDTGTAWVPYGYVMANATVSSSITNGQILVASPSVTITLPALTAGSTVGIFTVASVTGATPVTVSGSTIRGVGVSANSFTLGTPGACVLLQSDGAAWRIISGQQDSGWQALTLANGVGSLGYTPAARLQGDVVELRGVLQNNSGSTIALGTTVATIPAGLRPASTVVTAARFISSTGAMTLGTISTSGQIVVRSGAGPDWGTGQVGALDGVSFSLS